VLGLFIRLAWGWLLLGRVIWAFISSGSSGSLIGVRVGGEGGVVVVATIPCFSDCFVDRRLFLGF
jgi:hypothetical protein